MLTQAIENLLNRNLPRSPRALELCAALTGKRVRVEAQGSAWVLLIECMSTSVRLTKNAPADPPADAEISGTLLNLAALAGSHPEEVIQRGDVRIEGNAEVAQQFRELAMLLKPDVEEELSRSSAIRPLTRRCASCAWRRGLAGAPRARASATSPNTWPTKVATSCRAPRPKIFYHGVERLREDLDRLEARTRLLDEPAVEDEIPR
jgi:ubiquinone biosynthesis protein UbiJ